MIFNTLLLSKLKSDFEKHPLFQHKLQEKCSGKTLSEHEIALEDFIISGIGRSKVASMIYSIYKNNDKGIGFSDGKCNIPLITSRYFIC